jgi:signal transduction histidine kinase
MKTMSKEQTLQETYDYYWMSALDSNYPLDKIEEYFTKNMMGYGTVIDEMNVSIEDMLAFIIRQREQSVGIEMHHSIKPIFRNVIANGNAAIFVDEVTISINMGNDKHEFMVRNTLIMEYWDNRWKVVHFHASIPVYTQSETDTWHIEEWKKKNEELQKLVDERTSELRTSLEKLKSTQAQLIQKEKLASLGELTAGIAHEIQNPLNFVNNFSEVSSELVDEMEEELKAGNADIALEIATDLKQNLSKINHHGKRASSIVKGMLEHSRMSTGVKELTDINKLADEYLRLSYHGLRAKDKDFNSDYDTDFDENLPKIEVIPQDIGRVLLNLINNAFYAVNSPLPAAADRPNRGTKKTPLVTVSTKYITPPSGRFDDSTGGAIEISVRDNGTGIPEEVQSKIFQPFFTTKPTGQGTGLGLSLAYDIVTKGHGGTLEVESVEGEGTTFTVKLPILT